jgi:ParB-like chromosome segregation protein Spo0J
LTDRKQPRTQVASTNESIAVAICDLPNHWPAKKIEFRSIDSLIFYAKNARIHSDAQVAQLAANMNEFGWTSPCLVDETGLLIAGHGRVLAARMLGLVDVPVMIATGWSEAKRRAYTLADNKLALNAGWDEAMLAIELNELSADAFDMSLIGFSADELAELSADRNEGLTDPDEVPNVPAVPVSRPGDVWLLGATVTCSHCHTNQPVRRA